MELEYTSAGCNRCVGNVAWNDEGIVAFGSHRVVVLYNIENGRVEGTLLGHEDVVTNVVWLPDGRRGTDGRFLVSGGGDGCLCVWKVYATCGWELCQKIEGHGGPVTCVAVERMGHGGFVLVSGGGDGDAVVYGLDIVDDMVSCKETQRLSFGTKLVHCAAIGMLPHPGACDGGSHQGDGIVLVALGCVDGLVKLYMDEKDSLSSFTLACVLSGHQNWIRGVDFVRVGDKKLMLATGSQDRYVRLWSIEDSSSEQSQGDSMLSKLGITKYAPKPQIRVDGRPAYTVILEALLVGHEDWVMSVAWNIKRCSDISDLTLLSSSMDRTMILWKKDVQSGVWLSSEVVGDAGINHLGYYTCTWSCDGSSIAAHGYTGALHVWDRVDGSLIPRTAGSGHMGPVVDSSWSRDGLFLLTVSEDQTARIFTESRPEPGAPGEWCEIARPQIHGHDFSCAAMVSAPGDTSKYKYVSGSEEKVLRVFESPRAFLDTLMAAQGHDVALSQEEAGGALGATLPALGLSNKAVLVDEDQSDREQSGGGYDDGADLAPTSAPSMVTCPPLEEHLSQNTLWPETHKLYGHGNDVYCVAASPRGDCVASASRAQSVSTAGIIVWNTESWTLSATLDGHTLTVTHLEFSPCGEFLASAGRDRKMCIFKRGSGIEFSRACLVKAHARIIWGLAWTPDSKYIVTASRDSTIKVWKVNAQGIADETPVGKMSCESSVQSVSCQKDGDSILIAAGLENGHVHVYRFQERIDASECIESVYASPARLKHAAAVRRVQWRPGQNKISSVGDDHAVKIWNIHM